MPSASGDDGLLEQALADLKIAFDATADTWRDQARDEFAQHHLAEIEVRVRQAVRAIRQLDNLSREAVRQCS